MKQCKCYVMHAHSRTYCKNTKGNNMLFLSLCNIKDAKKRGQSALRHFGKSVFFVWCGFIGKKIKNIYKAVKKKTFKDLTDILLKNTLYIIHLVPIWVHLVPKCMLNNLSL